MMGVRRKQCLHSCTEITITNFLEMELELR